MESLRALLGLFVLFTPFFLLQQETEYCISARLPRLIPLLRLLLAKEPYRIFKKIAERSFYSKNYTFHYSPSTQAERDWYRKETEKGFSNRIGRHRTLVVANRILEFRLWLHLRKCKNYDELRAKAIRLMSSESKEGFVFVSSPLYAHPQGLKKGIQELRKAIIHQAEEHHGRVFNQIPFLNLYLAQLRSLETRNKFALFYEPVIQSSPISAIVMNQGWEQSQGCKTEHEAACQSSKKIEYYMPKK